MIKIRLFLLSYLTFYKIFLNYKNKTWNELNIDDKKVLNMMLVNGGGKFMCNIFEDILPDSNVALNRMISLNERQIHEEFVPFHFHKQFSF